MSNDGVKGQWKCPTQIFQPDSNRRILRPARWMCVRVVSPGAFSLDLEIAPRKIWRNTEIQDGAPKIGFSWDVVAKKLWFMVDITNQLMGFINQLITGGGPCTLKYHFCSVQFLYPRKICRLRELKLLRILEAYIHGIPGLKMFMDFFHWKAMTLGWNMMESLRGLCWKATGGNGKSSKW